jgi:hypothetical protein
MTSKPTLIKSSQLAVALKTRGNAELMILTSKISQGTTLTCPNKES